MEYEDIFKGYDREPKLLFKNIYPHLQTYIDEYNVYNAGLFVSRAFSDINLKAEVLWDFIMGVAAKLSQYPE